MPSLLDLPTELLMEIVMYQPELDVDVDADIVTYTPGGQPPIGSKEMKTTRCVRYRKPVVHYTASPFLWLTVTMLECNMSNWKPMAEFIRVLGLLQNLQDLTILQVSSEMVPVLESSCHGKVFPWVLKLTLSDPFTTVIHSFPNVEVLAYYHNNYMTGILKAIKGPLY
ncbi:hypothetical protein DFH06DRAFT_1471615 [Mycena polygramma]|nr:hypothetical protein DFH06DRAFT_1471615 [Mycena polygramma]